MEYLSNSQITEKLQNNWNDLTKYYDEKQLLGIFIVGAANRYRITSTKDIHMIAIYLPSIEEISTNSFPEPVFIINGNTIEILDIRLLYYMCVNQEDIKPIELLYSPYFILSPYYDTLVHQTFLLNISNYFDFNFIFQKFSYAGRVALESGDTSEAYYIYLFLNNFTTTLNYRKSMFITNIYDVDKIKNLKTQQFLVKDDKLNEKLSNYFANIQTTYSKTDYEHTNFRKDITLIMEKYLNIEEFNQNIFEELTKTEKKALVHIIKQIGKEGSIIISQEVAETGISRPVYISLTNKLVKFRAADVKNTGAKGTYFRFSQDVIDNYYKGELKNVK